MREGLLGTSRFESGISRKLCRFTRKGKISYNFVLQRMQVELHGKPSGDRVRIPLSWQCASAISMQGVSSIFVAAPFRK